MRMRIEGGRALVGDGLEETSVDVDCEAGIITGVGAQASAERVIDARGFCGPARDRRRPWRCLRAADDAAAGRRISDRCGAARKRSASGRQRHDHRLPRRDVVVGRRSARGGECARDSRRHRALAAAARRRHPLPSASRDLQSRDGGFRTHLRMHGLCPAPPLNRRKYQVFPLTGLDTTCNGLDTAAHSRHGHDPYTEVQMPYLSDSVVRNLPVPEKTHYHITYDSGPKRVPGFGVRVTEAGYRSFILNYPGGRYTIGRFGDWSTGDARQEAKRLRREIDLGADPMRDRKAEREAPTIADLVQRVEAEHLPRLRPATAATIRAQLKNHVLP